MVVHCLSDNHSVLDVFIAQLRDERTQIDSMRFRRNLERIGEILAYEISKTFIYKNKTTKTPLSNSESFIPIHPIVVSSILRAGLPLHQGILNYFDAASSSFVTSFTSHKEGSIVYKEPHVSRVNIDDSIVIVADTMLATGSSLVAAHQMLSKMIKEKPPIAWHLAVVVASKQGLEYLKNVFLDASIHLWVIVVDNDLDDKGYIIPGLGDAGDLAFGSM